MKGNVIPKDFAAAVKDIKLAILQARAKAAHLANAEALKLYFFVGGYISKKTRNAKWGSGAINALSERLQVELPGLRGFSVANMKNMRIFFEAWCDIIAIRSLAMNESHYLSSNDLNSGEIRQMPSDETTLAPIRQMPSDEFGINLSASFLSVGFSHHVKILMSCKQRDEIWYYIARCARETWSYQDLLTHLRADD
ncbi:MAG: hypothetical protein IKO55_14720, partial [Kiritimatiellae bacterium]|nr:hypothetical protein [Kiritimatiellia bacterium]